MGPTEAHETTARTQDREVKKVREERFRKVLEEFEEAIDKDLTTVETTRTSSTECNLLGLLLIYYTGVELINF